MTVAVLPASFDPITCGHLDIIQRSALLFDCLVVAVYAQPKKSVMFSLDERVAMVRESAGSLANVEVRAFDGLLVRFVREVQATVLVRGLRWVSDFEYEFQQAAANRRLLPGLETICVFASTDYVYFSSSIIKEIAEHGGDVSSMVPEAVSRRLAERFPVRVQAGSARR
ncbi:MAG: pantetheine-phosphate adenylyltransferase [Chloroflexota bacterium]